MQLVCPSDPIISIPLNIRDGFSEIGPRIGGRSPEGIIPTLQNSLNQYFLTIPFSKQPKLELSIFLCSDFEQLLKICGILNKNKSGVEVLLHPESLRGNSSQFLSPLTEHPLILQEPQDDWMFSDEGKRLVASNHKIGGRPYFIRRTPTLEIAVDSIIMEGFMQVLQMDFPPVEGDMGEVEGDWPFGDGMFHLFGRTPFNERDWCWFWEK